MRIVALQSPEDRWALPNSAALPSFDAKLILDHNADAHLCAIVDGETQAHCSLWWNSVPSLGNHRLGAIGHYAAADDISASAILLAALEHLRVQQCTVAVGPMDGNTWRPYRFVTESLLDEPPFFLEPANPLQWPRQFERAGFTPLAQYFSAINCDLAQTDKRIVPAIAKMESLGITIRSAAGTDLSRQLRRIYQVSRIAFVRNFLYTELPEEEFLAQYTPLLPRVQSELILLAERAGELVGFLFAIPDFAQAARGAAIDTFLIKTVAILPDPSLRGLGSVLVASAHQEGHRLGYRRAIHALMHESNTSMRISGHYAVPMRRYTIYARELAP